jgi:hypothetical protein
MKNIYNIPVGKLQREETIWDTRGVILKLTLGCESVQQIKTGIGLDPIVGSCAHGISLWVP